MLIIKLLGESTMNLNLQSLRGDQRVQKNTINGVTRAFSSLVMFHKNQLVSKNFTLASYAPASK